MQHDNTGLFKARHAATFSAKYTQNVLLSAT
jgi:hypothetical protein